MLTIGRYRARRASTPADLLAAQSLRARAFFDRVAPPDQDAFDPFCTHILIDDLFTAQLVCCFRMLPLDDGTQIARSYSAQFYDLSALAGYDAPMAEVGRFCMDPQAHDPDILRVAWGGMAKFVDETGIELLFGCSSFKGLDPQPYNDAFAMLRQHHLAPERWTPKVKAPSIYPFAERVRQHKRDRLAGLRSTPPLLRTYLSMGGWVSDHAVHDPDMNTLHVFTGLEISAVPPARKRLLRHVAGYSPA